MSENKIIKIIKSYFPNDWEKDYGNDCAYIKKHNMLITKDLLVEGTHFLKDYPIEAIAYKSLAVNISDVVSDGGIPKFVILGIGFNKENEEKVELLFENYLKICKKNNIRIIGGDLVFSPIFFISVTCIGYSNSPWLRKNVGKNDSIYISGPIGGSYKGFKEIKEKGVDLNNKFVLAHLFPPIRIKKINNINKKYKINAGIDISDGLIKDLLKLSLESNKSILIEFDKIPFFPGLSDEDKFESMFWGEDYEIVFTSSDNITDRGIRKIGRVINEKTGLFLKKKDKIIIYNRLEEIEKKGFYHL